MEGSSSASGEIQEAVSETAGHVENIVNVAVDSTREVKNEAAEALFGLARRITDAAERLVKAI